MGSIERAIHQEHFASKEEKAIINLAYTYQYLSYNQLQLLKPFDISIQQFNVLRILKGRHPEPTSITLLTQRMIDKTSNASRLVEKLGRKDLIARTVSNSDRRKVDVVITKKGLKLIDEASKEMNKFIENNIQISAKDAAVFNRILDTFRHEEWLEGN